MLEEAVVLGGEEGLHHDLGDLPVGNRQAPLLADLADQAAVAAVHPQRHLQLQLPQLGDIGQGGLQVVVGGQERHADDPCQRDDHDGGDLQSAARATFHRRLAVNGREGADYA